MTDKSLQGKKKRYPTVACLRFSVFVVVVVIFYHSTITGLFVAVFSDYWFSNKFTSQGAETEAMTSPFLKQEFGERVMGL